MNDELNFFRSLAHNLILADQGGELPKRYLQLCRRQKALKRIIAQARKWGRRNNMLAEVGFRAPLSVAGETSSIVMVCVDGLKMAGVPVATELDEKKEHRGTPLYDLMATLETETGREWGVIEVMDMYKRLMSAHPDVIGSHEIPRYRKVPRLKRMIRAEMQTLQARMGQFVRIADTRIFSVAVDSTSLFEAIGNCSGPSVTVGFKEGSQLVLDGEHRALVGWGHGNGLCVMALDDLLSLASTCKIGDLVVLDCELDGWEAWKDSAVAVVQSVLQHEMPECRQFEYFSGSER